VTGSGTANTIPLWTTAGTLGNSTITQVGPDIGINLATPAATLDVGGTATIRGALTVSQIAPATTATGENSQHLNLTASAWSTATNSASPQTFDWVAAAIGNNTATPSGALYLQFQSGTAGRINLFDIDSSGVFHWAPTQTFPGTVGSVTATSPVTATTKSGAVSLGLNTTALETTLNSVYPQLGAANTFTQPITFASSQTFPGAGTITGVTTTSPLTGNGTSGSVALGIDEAALFTELTPTLNNNYPQLATGVLGNTFSGGEQYFDTEVWMTSAPPDGTDTLSVFNTGQAKDANAFYAASYSSNAPVYVDGNESGVSIAAYGSASAGAIGVLGGFDDISSTTFQEDNGTRGYSAGLWADNPRAFATTALFATADSSNAAIFENNSATAPTMYVANLATGGPTGNAVLLRAEGASGVCSINQGGSMACTGQLKNLVTTHDARQVETYSVQSAENWLEDYGGGQLQNGSATVALDPAFANTVNTSVEFHVFLTPKGDCEGLYVTNQTPTSFEVHELRRGQSNVSFDYKIVARRSGHESERLVDVTDRMNLEAETSRFQPRPDGPPANPHHPGISRTSRKLPPQLALKTRP